MEDQMNRKYIIIRIYPLNNTHHVETVGEDYFIENAGFDPLDLRALNRLLVGGTVGMSDSMVDHIVVVRVA
jgi:hypothetical protein